MKEAQILPVVLPQVPFRSRIVGHGEEDVDQMLANPYNWRIHPRLQQEALSASLDELGFIRSVLINRTTGHVIDGHLRILLASRAGTKSLPVEYVELDEAEEKLALVLLDPITNMAVSDQTKLNELLALVQVSQPVLQEMLSNLALSEEELATRLDFSEFSPAALLELRYRVVVEDLTLTQAQELAATLDTANGHSAKIEQYRL